MRIKCKFTRNGSEFLLKRSTFMVSIPPYDSQEDSASEIEKKDPASVSRNPQREETVTRVPLNIPKASEIEPGDVDSRIGSEIYDIKTKIIAANSVLPLPVSVAPASQERRLELAREGTKPLADIQSEVRSAIGERVSLDSLNQYEIRGNKLAGRYEFSNAKFLTQGGEGKIYEAIDSLSGRPVIIKTVLSLNERNTQRFLREMIKIGLLNIPNIPDILEAGVFTRPNSETGQEEKVVFYVMPKYVEGLNDLYTKTLFMPPEEKLQFIERVFVPLSKALAELHDVGVLHRDIKPANVLIDMRGQPILADFGLAKEKVKIARESLIVGTVSYMAPEQFFTPHETDAAADVYSLGLTLFNLFSHKELPVKLMDEVEALNNVYNLSLEQKKQIVQERMKSKLGEIKAALLSSNIPVRIADLITQMLDPYPQYRLKSSRLAHEFQSACFFTRADILTAPDKLKKQIKQSSEEISSTDDEDRRQKLIKRREEISSEYTSAMEERQKLMDLDDRMKAPNRLSKMPEFPEIDSSKELYDQLLPYKDFLNERELNIITTLKQTLQELEISLQPSSENLLGKEGEVNPELFKAYRRTTDIIRTAVYYKREKDENYHIALNRAVHNFSLLLNRDEVTRIDPENSKKDKKRPSY